LKNDGYAKPGIDFAQLIKLYGKPDNAGPDWYGPAKVIETVPKPVSGNPDEAHISTKPCGAVKSEFPNAHAEIHTASQRFQQEAG
jgi:hypothetical protein